MDIKEKENVFKVSVPLITDEEIRNINNNFDSIVNEFTKQFVHQKDLAITQYIIKKQQAELERLQNNEEILNGELARIGIETLGLEKGSSTDDIIEEIKKKDKIIDEMAKYIASLDTDEDICKNIQCTDGINKLHKNCSECIKQYFTKKVEGK